MSSTDSDDEQLQKRRRTYGRGFVDGLLSAGVSDIEAHMNNAKLIEAEKGQTGIARKVLFTLPTDSGYSRPQILASLRDKGVNLNIRVLDGCLSKLYASGLIRETDKDCFKRVPLKHPAPSNGHAPVSNEPPAPLNPVLTASPAPALSLTPEHKSELAASETGTALERLAQLAAAVRALASEATRLASEIEDVALSIEPPPKKEETPDELLARLALLIRNKTP